MIASPRVPLALIRHLSSSATSSVHSLKRKQALTLGHPHDNAGDVQARIDPGFNLQKTIFKTLPKGSLLEKVQTTKLDTVLDWSSSASAEIESEYNSLALPPSGDEKLHEFMAKNCDFNSEHADGSFYEHLHFCRDFTALHFPSGSPRVMLLHSITGVGTNEFPLAVSQLPALAELVTEDEMKQVTAFPSLLRLLVSGPLLSELEKCDVQRLSKLKSIQFHRVIDDAPITLTAPELWEALHYHLIHSIDFLPAAAWKRTSNEFMFHIYTSLYVLLSRSGNLKANVSWDEAWMKQDVNGARPDTWRHWIVDMVPNDVVRKMAAKQIGKYSAEIGHSLDYTLVFEE